MTCLSKGFNDQEVPGLLEFCHERRDFIRGVYFAMLISHILLATAIVPLILITLTLAVRGRFDRHRRWARWTFPLWYYVSVTGVLVYLFLYQWWPAAP